MDERAASSVRLGSRAVTAVGALVIIGDRYRCAYAASRQGIPVWVLKSDPGVMAFSRYYRNNLPRPVGDEERQVGYLQISVPHTISMAGRSLSQMIRGDCCPPSQSFGRAFSVDNTVVE
jgi:hypothetical protein